MPKKQITILDVFKRSEKNVELSTSSASTRNQVSETHSDGAVNYSGQQSSTCSDSRSECLRLPLSTDAILGENTEKTIRGSSFDKTAEGDASSQGGLKRKWNFGTTRAQKSRQSSDGPERRSAGGKERNNAIRRAERGTGSTGKGKRKKPIGEYSDESGEGEKRKRNRESSGSDENAEDDALPSKLNRNSGSTRAQKSRRSSEDSARRSVGGERQSRNSSIDELPLDLPLGRYVFIFRI